MAKYPNEIFEPRPKENRSGVSYDPNKKTVIFVEDIKALDEEIQAIEIELGTNPKGTFASVKDFLQYLLGKVKDYFTDLLDVPHSYQGQAGKFLKVKSTEDGLEFGEVSGGVLNGINTQTGASYTLQLSDVGKLVQMNNNSENTVIIPSSSSVNFPIGTEIAIQKYGAGDTTIQADTDVILRDPNSGATISTQYDLRVILKIGTDEWVLQ